MKKALQLVVIVLVAACFTGCGSIFIGGTTHTHFYPGDKVDTDEANTEGIANYFKFIKDRMNADTEPMKDFRWTDKVKEKEEKDDRF